MTSVIFRDRIIANYKMLCSAIEVAEGPRDTLSVEIMSTAAQLY